MTKDPFTLLNELKSGKLDMTHDEFMDWLRVVQFVPGMCAGIRLVKDNPEMADRFLKEQGK